MIKDVGKSQGWLTTNWRTRNDSGLIQSKSEGLRSSGGDGVSPSANPKSLEPGTRVSKDRRRWLSQLTQREQSYPLLLPFSSIQDLNGLNDAYIILLTMVTPTSLIREKRNDARLHRGAQSALLSLLIQTLISSRNTFTDTPRKSVLLDTWVNSRDLP